MNKKILIGSILSVAVIISVSFTSVVGYGSVESNVKASPLFAVRSSRAVDKESKDFTCDYVGKGEVNFLSIPKRDSQKVSLQKIIDIIRTMDNVTFSRFINLIIFKIQQSNDFKDVNINEVITTIHQIRDNPEIISLEYVDKKGDPTLKHRVCTLKDWFIPTVCWFPGCIPLLILLLLLSPLIIYMLTLAMANLTFSGEWCVDCQTG